MKRPEIITLNIVSSLPSHAAIQIPGSNSTARLTRILCRSLIFIGLIQILLTPVVHAETVIVASNTLQAFSISANSMEDALNRFAKQAGIKISFSNIEVKGLMTHGLNGNFTIQDGLKHLLAGSNLEMIRQADGFTVKRTSAPTSGLDSVVPLTVLPVVKVMSSAMGG
jgi:catecholate siderophore receptor